MKGGAQKGTARTPTGRVGPMIKYPGYVDYGHPYFSPPYDKMPELAFTAGYQQGANPCPPTLVMAVSHFVWLEICQFHLGWRRKK